MRVISGKYKGRKLMGFDTLGTRPTMDRVKESLFGTIQNYIKDSVFLDLFAGSGSIGIEALSNGCLECYFVDNGKDILNVLKNNLDGVDNSIIVNKDFKDALTAFKKQGIKFDLIYIDPPYHLSLASKALKLIKELDLLKDNGICIVEYEEEKIDELYNLLKTKKYGKININIYQNKVN